MTMSFWDEFLNPAFCLVMISIGLVCMLTGRRVVKQVIGLSIMLQGALVSVIDAGWTNGEMEMAQSMVISALIVEAIVLAIALALIVNIFRYHPHGDIDAMNSLRG
ncbi:MAG: NADH-quinone oxidoreductase subunit K [Chloroflexi bacterium]|nr:NADH-quinone oxidoreductase subunit K [Chloroflexota bacterium]